jgi:glycosyltransferase involved in cell wall biosynthesis
LLVPSQWEDETWGRVVTEAQFSGIPVVTSDRGGLPESVGPGGIVLPYDAPATAWAEVLTALWSDEARYAPLSQAALDHAARAEIDLEHQVSQLMDTLNRIVESVPV